MGPTLKIVIFYLKSYFDKVLFLDFFMKFPACINHSWHISYGFQDQKGKGTARS